MTGSFSMFLLFLWSLSLVRVQALPFLKATKK
nr:MAG TPA: hypothetical protein [Caudoviricetes sp.]DAQ60963.1 MAG TPA: hypothetical protein [Caudoviricetes sp.]